MQISTFLTFIRTSFSLIPWVHWIIMGVLALIFSGILLIRKRTTVYGGIVFGIMVLAGLFLLDTLMLTRCLGIMPSFSGQMFNLAAEYDRLINGGAPRRIEMLKNILAFIPFGFFLSEFLSSTKRFGPWRRLGYVALVAFGLSLCIETLQLFLNVGFFELTDLVMNTVGGCVGGGVSVMGRWVWMRGRRSYPIRTQSK